MIICLLCIFNYLNYLENNDCRNNSSSLHRIICRNLASNDDITKSAGSGGGAVINVLLIIGLGYNAKESIIITYIFLMGGGLASSIASLNKTTA